MTNHPSIFSQMEGSVDAGSTSPGTDISPECAIPVKKESSYYMDNYEATVTVHKSPPLQRRQYSEYLEIDDETTHEFEPVYSRSRLSKRKNLRVTFSDHIEVDVIDSDDGYFVDAAAEEDATIGVDSPDGCCDLLTESITESKQSKLINLDLDVHLNQEIMSPRPSQGKPQRSASGSSVAKSFSARTERATRAASTSQPLLPKRKQQPRASLSDLEKRTQDSIAKLNSGRYQRPSGVGKSQGQILPDLLKPIPPSAYSQFISNAKQMVEVTRRYERPWVVGKTTSGWSRGGQENVRRSASLPKNFKLPDNLPVQHLARSSSSSAGYNGRQKVKNA